MLGWKEGRTLQGSAPPRTSTSTSTSSLPPRATTLAPPPPSAAACEVELGVGDRGGKRSRLVDGEGSEAGGEAVGAVAGGRAGGGGSKPSLAAAAELWLGKKLSKRQRMSNWVRILPSNFYFLFFFTKSTVLTCLVVARTCGRFLRDSCTMRAWMRGVSLFF